MAKGSLRCQAITALCFLAMLASSNEATAQAGPELPAVFGMQLASPLVLKACAHRNAYPKHGACVENKRAVATSKVPFTGETQINFAWGELPQWVASSKLYVDVIDGRLERIWIITTNVRAGPNAYRDLVGKFGTPATSNVRPLQNDFGATLTSIEADWGMPFGRVSLTSNVSGTDQGSVTIATTKGGDAYAARVSRETTRRPL